MLRVEVVLQSLDADVGGGRREVVVAKQVDRRYVEARDAARQFHNVVARCSHGVENLSHRSLGRPHGI